MPTKKMILTQNLVFNLPTCVVMTLTAALASGAGLNPGTIIQYFIGLVVIEILGAVIPVQKIAMGIGARFFPGKNPMAMPQFLLPAAVLTVIFTVPMTLVMTAVGLKMGGQPMNIYWFAFLGTLPKMLLAAYISVLIFLPLSMKVSGMDKLGAPPQA
ncbi:MAG: hypothetical protein IJ649_07760 [Oscillospiraceae bacterium]|nr:hypothetical protein [Oscillospiraceae bacterium]MBR1566645.1 hypothetical protein [Oscillospiraceae bacterium]